MRGKAGLYPELKSPPLYTGRGVDMAKLFVESVKKHGLDRPESLKTTPVIIQSFDEATIKRMATELPTIPRVFLTSDDADVTDARLKELAGFATGIAPNKNVIAKHPDMVARAHALGLTVTSWTFGADEKTSQPGRPRRDVALSLHARDRRALHQQPGSLPEKTAVITPRKHETRKSFAKSSTTERTEGSQSHGF